MSLLDIILLWLWFSAGIWAYLWWSDSLYKLFLGLIIGFLSYLVVSYQIELSNYMPLIEQNWYQKFLSKHYIGVLTLALLFIPILGVFFMMNPRISILTKSRSLSQILLWILLPIFLIWILSLLSDSSILSDSSAWKKVFDFFAWSWLYQIFQKLPWGIFLLLAFLIFYKSIFLLLSAFCVWLWKDVISLYFKDWREKHKKTSSEDISEEALEDID